MIGGVAFVICGCMGVGALALTVFGINIHWASTLFDWAWIGMVAVATPLTIAEGLITDVRKGR